MENKKSLEFIEFETKYRVEAEILVTFKQILDGLPQAKTFIYVEGPDQYFSYPDWWLENNKQYDPNGTFIRYRKPSYGLDRDRKQVTWKYKCVGSTNNIQREELNWDATNIPEETVLRQLVLGGAKFNFSIIKNCHIYKLEDATLVFYTVYDTTDGKPSKTDNFLEIEVDEDSMKDLTEAQAWHIIEKYEKILQPLGVTPQKRLRKSLYEMYKR